MSRNSNFGYTLEKLPGTLHEDPNMFYCYWNTGAHGEGDWVSRRGREGQFGEKQKKNILLRQQFEYRTVQPTA
jgi:hypothetical protein